MSVRAVRCEACGGAVAFPAGAATPACLFCGSTVLVATPAPEGIEPPEGFLPFRVDADAARAAFRRFASSSIWYPGDLRHARLDIHAVLVPAWRWSATLETTWAALLPAPTRSGKRPHSGADRTAVDGVLIPASQALSRHELDAIAPFAIGADEGTRLEPVGGDTPYETGSLTRTAAQLAGQAGLQAVRQRALLSETGARELRTSVVFHDLTGGPLLLPVWIGAYRRGDSVYRIVINGQTGALTGKAPISYARVALAVFGVLALFGLLLLCTGVLTAVGASR